MATGIDIKMKEDVQSKARADGIKQMAYWTKTKTRENQPLAPVHVLASIFMLSGGLVIATISFMGEKLHHKLNKKTSTSQQREAW